MKNIVQYILIVLVILGTSCSEKVEYIKPTWAQAIVPEEGATVKIDYFKPEEKQVFKWQPRQGATFKISFDVDMHFQNAYTFDVGDKDSLDITNTEFLEVLREVWPNFTSIKRFFWKIEQKTGDNISTSWRFFDAILAVESFVDERDGEQYGASQFVLSDGSLITIMSENLRAQTYSDGSELLLPYKGADTSDEIFNHKAGGYYSWVTAMNGVTWDEAKSATLDKNEVQGICPEGWHLPSYDEINKLREFWGKDTGGNTVKDPSYWKTTDNITNSNKMNIIGSGYYWHEGVKALTGAFGSDIPTTRMWSASPCLAGMEFAWGEKATDDNKDKAVLMSLSDDVEGVYVQAYSIVPGVENNCCPVRCIMDKIE